MSSDLIEKIIKLDHVAEIKNYDILAGVSTTLAIMPFESANFWESQKYYLHTMALTLPSWIAIAQRQLKYKEVAQIELQVGTGSMANCKNAEKLGSFLLEVADIFKGMQSYFNRTEDKTEVFARRANACKEYMVGYIKGLKTPSDDIIKQWDKRYQELLDLSFCGHLIQSLKEISGNSGGGLRHFDKLVTAFSAAGIESSGNETFENYHKLLHGGRMGAL